MKSVRGLLFGVVGLLVLSSCGDSASNADQLAAEACGLELVDAGDERVSGIEDGDGDGKTWTQPDLTAESFWRYTDPIEEIEAMRDRWANRAPKASAAAQEFEGFRSLAEAITEMLSFVREVLVYRERGSTETSFFSVYSTDMYNGPLSSFKSDCAGLSVRLNG